MTDPLTLLPPVPPAAIDQAPRRRERLLVIDLARSLALLGMVAFHLTYDLDMFGWLPRGTAVSGWFWYHARIVAGGFILLAGLGLWMAHGQGIGWPSFWRRLAKIAAAAALVSLATWIAMPEMMIFYGILHSIAVSSLVGLLVLRLPWAVNLALAALVFWLPYLVQDPAFGGALIWTGLSGLHPSTADFEPFFPWFAPFVLGIALGQICTDFALWPRLRLAPRRSLQLLAWPGQHSLAIYLIHQPILLALVYGATILLRG